MPVLVATSNEGKLREFRGLLRGLDVASPHDAGVADLQVDETGETFRDNALLKARAYTAASGWISVADDSGLEVDALDGRPGVRSARYGGAGLDDVGRYRHLLEEMRDVPDGQRTAHFCCHLALVTPDGRTIEAQGRCSGHILQGPAGDGGFGYDPVFHVPQYGRSMASLSRAEKAAVSHRGQALRALVVQVRQSLPELFPSQ